MAGKSVTAGSTGSTSTLKTELSALRSELALLLPAEGRPVDLKLAGTELGRRNAARSEELLRPLFERISWGNVGMAAVGGFGRRMLALRSDIDVRIVVKTPDDAERIVDAVIYPLWDATFAIGHQVITVSDALDIAREDLATATSFLDYRHLAGDRSLGDELLWRASGSLFGASELGQFHARLTNEIATRHERYGDSVYLLEPDVKNGAGGLRDLDVFRWAAAARYGTGELEGLVRVGALVPREAQELGEAQETLWRIRQLLHQHAGRRSDRLTFDEQEVIAPLLEYGSGGEGVEQLMSAYYRSARTISRGVTLILTRAQPVSARNRPKDEDLGGGLGAFDGAITVRDFERLQSEPGLALKAISLAVEKKACILPYLRERIMSLSSDAEWCEKLRADDQAKKHFVELITSRREVKTARGKTSAPKELHELGLVTAMVPEFLPVVGRVHHDLYHVYTVDVHSVAAVDRLAALARGDLAAEYPLASRLAAEVSRPAMLSFAVLLHDVGKAIGGKDHSLRGAEMSHTILARLGFKEADVEAASDLIREHLSLYRLATRRDVDDPATVAEALKAVKSREALRDLFLLTVVDVSTTSPTSMTSWKAHMLDELFIAVDAALSGQTGDEGLRAQSIESVKKRAEELGSSSAFLDQYLNTMPERYLLSSKEDSVIAHASLAEKHGAAKGEGVTLGLVPSSHPEAAELCVVAKDRPGLLAMITAALADSRLEVHAAQIHSRKLPDGSVEAVDLFWVRDRTDGAHAAARALPRLERDLAALAGGQERKAPAARTAPVRSARVPRVPTRIHLDGRASPVHTVVEVTTHDRPGLLCAISNALFDLGLTIAVAKINTEGASVADVFYVSEQNGSKVSGALRAAEIEEKLFHALGEEPPQKPLQNNPRAAAEKA